MPRRVADQPVEPLVELGGRQGALVQRDGIHPQPVLGVRQHAAHHLLGRLVHLVHGYLARVDGQSCGRARSASSSATGCRGVRRRPAPGSAAGSWSPASRGTPGPPARARSSRPPARRRPSQPMSSIASAQLAPVADHRLDVAVPRAAPPPAPARRSAALDARRATRACTRSSGSVPSRVVYAGRDQTANERSAAMAPTLGGDRGRGDHEVLGALGPPYAAVTRRTSASAGSGSLAGPGRPRPGELCSSRSVTLPRATWPNTRPTTTRARSGWRRAARPPRAARRAPTGRCAGRTSR